ncbi:MAG: VanZ family protein [Sedimentisphaerales bacterium]|nr:VanZ family protein [Sedimentisphaerales bacterium]
MDKKRRRTLLAWLVLLIYWPAIFVATHLPRLPPVSLHGGDKTAHFLVFFFLTILFWLARYGKLRPGVTKRPFWRCLLWLALYGAIDEISQNLVPNRCADAVDWIADMGGVLAGLAVLALMRRWVYWLIVLAGAILAGRHWPGPQRPIESLPLFWRQFELAYILAAYALLTLLWWLSWCPAGRIVWRRRIGIATLTALPAFLLLDEGWCWWQWQTRPGAELLCGLGGILLGVVCAWAFCRQHEIAEAEKCGKPV